MPLYYVVTDLGCGIRCARDKRQAWSNLLREEGTSHAKYVKLATQTDINDVRAMGEYVPIDEYKKSKSNKQSN